jgi:hypothetical protein
MVFATQFPTRKIFDDATRKWRKNMVFKGNDGNMHQTTMRLAW